MRILKYLFLLLLLFLIGLTVFVTTQKGDYSITQSKVIKTQRATVYNYVNDYRNWETFGSWLKDEDKLQLRYSGKTSGKDALMAWNGGQSEGKVQTLSAKENESISQKMVFNGTESEIYWMFKDTLGATKVSWQAKGKMSAMMKIKAFFRGGMESLIGGMYQKSLLNLDRTLDYEINTYSIRIANLVTLPKTFYIGQTINSHNDKIIKNTKVLLPKMLWFFEKNNIATGGKPFLRYNRTSRGVSNFTVAIPMRDSVYIMAGSELESGETQNVTALKVILTGDYSHLGEARIKAADYLRKHNLRQNPSGQLTESYIKTVKDTKQPSKWVTEVYVPVYPKTAAPKPYRPKDSTAVVQPAVREQPVP